MPSTPLDMTELFAWTENDPEGGEGIIACMLPEHIELGIVPLVTRSESVARGAFELAARGHHKASGHRVRLVHWTARKTAVDLQREGMN